MTRDPEGSTPGWVTEHAYHAPRDKPWAPCVHCGLAEAAHERTETPYRSTAPKAKPQ